MADTFHGYKVDLLTSIKNLGRSIVGNDDLFDAAQEYTDPTIGGGIFGPALITKDCTICVTPPARDSAPVAEVEPVDPEVATEDPWADYTLVDLRDLMRQHDIVVPHALSYGKAIAALDEAGVKPEK
jgi:hypothetical protein